MIDNKTIAALRQEYLLKVFDESHLDADAMMQFRHWFKEALDAEVMEPNAMTLATSDETGKPSARIVLLKAIEHNGFVFYTNYESSKGQQIASNPHAALVFFWPELQRQVRIEGSIHKNSAEDADAYFLSRPTDSQIGAHASPQSRIIENRNYLENQFDFFRKEFADKPLTRPLHWGGYIVMPQSIEFWQGRQSRLHDRFLYTLAQDGQWKINRLAP